MGIVGSGDCFVVKAGRATSKEFTDFGDRKA